MNKTAERLKESIKKSGISQRELETITGIPHSAIQRYASGSTERIPSGRLLILASALNVSFSYLSGSDYEMAPEDAELIKSLGHIYPKEDLPDDVAALDVLFRELGWELFCANGEYYLGEIGLLSDADVKRLKTAAVSALKVTYDMMVKERGICHA